MTPQEFYDNVIVGTHAQTLVEECQLKDTIIVWLESYGEIRTIEARSEKSEELKKILKLVRGEHE